MIEINRQGCTRIVLLTKRHAIKLPNFLDGWRLFLKGLLANMNESNFGTKGFKGLCPVMFHIKGGFLVVMPRCRVLTDEEYLALDTVAFYANMDVYFRVEDKSNSFGYLNNEVVIIDYGE